jgi:hypothetical protein
VHRTPQDNDNQVVPFQEIDGSHAELAQGGEEEEEEEGIVDIEHAL